MLVLLSCVGAPDIVVEPEVLDFGAVGIGCAPAELEFEVLNVGSEPLHIDAFELVDATWEIEFEVPRVPGVLQPGGSIAGTGFFEPEGPEGAIGTLLVYSDDLDEPVVERSIEGTVAGGGSEHIGFDELAVGTRVGEQYADLGVHILGGGAPGEGLDTHVVERGGVCTSATLDSSPNVLCTYVNDGFNHAGEPGFAGWLDEPAEGISVRVYNAGLASAASDGADNDQATLVVLDEAGEELGRETAVARTDSGEEYVDLVVDEPGAAAFELFTGDFDAVDDLVILRDGGCP